MLLSSLSLLRRALFSEVGVRGSAAPEASVRVASIVRRHLDAVWRTARDLGVPERDLDDVVQEVMVVVVRRLDAIEAERERAFVLGATARVAANWRRRRRRHPEELTDSLDDVAGLDVPAGRAAFAGPEQACERSEKLRLLGRALQQMPEPLRVAFTLFELEQLTAKEVAEQLGVPSSVVFSRVRRAWVVFRQCCEQANVELRGEGEEPEDD